MVLCTLRDNVRNDQGMDDAEDDYVLRHVKITLNPRQNDTPLEKE